MVTLIDRDELKARLDRGDDFAIVEALPAQYYEDAHLPGALNLPHDEVAALAPSLLPDRNREVVVYCSNAACQNSTIAANRLAVLGYANVRKYEAGKADWIDAGFAVERGAAVSA